MMQNLLKRCSSGPAPLALILFVCAVVFHFMKKLTLSFHTRDYPYYLVALDSRIGSLFGETRQLLLQPKGVNIFGFSGIDGFPYAHNDVHFSPLTYILSAGFQIGGEPLIVAFYAALSVLWAFQLSGYALRRPAEERKRTVIILALAGFFLQFCTYDLRVWIPLVGFTVLLAMAVDRDETPRKILFLALLTLFTREESVFFVGIAAAHLFWKRRYALALTVGLATVLNVVAGYLYFFKTTAFTFSFTARNLVFLAAPLMLFVALAGARAVAVYSLQLGRIAALGLRVSAAGRRLYDRLFDSPFFVWINIYLFPLWANWATTKHNFKTLLSPRYMVLLFVVACLIMRKVSLNSRRRAAIAYGVASVILIHSVVSARPATALKNLATGREVWALSREIGHDTPIVTNFTYKQVFWNHSAVTVERLPAESADDEERAWPRNRRRLVPYIEAAEYVVLDNEGGAMIGSLLPERIKCAQAATVSICRP
ncbi:hypothetical protein [Azoarcus sp. KH32C]|uniref:hypothetical protein n=1 Tax=Azoarcus sp. KH32C TaxID=748247 RepID=UPI0002385F9A|nr:hypothetical protein [Azoarcus sp. KH32C]BAL22923.1 hypothetical protein AZKH_0577 [Azoarcus sp. KH32C]